MVGVHVSALAEKDGCWHCLTDERREEEEPAVVAGPPLIRTSSPWKLSIVDARIVGFGGGGGGGSSFFFFSSSPSFASSSSSPLLSLAESS